MKYDDMVTLSKLKEKKKESGFDSLTKEEKLTYESLRNIERAENRQANKIFEEEKAKEKALKDNKESKGVAGLLFFFAGFGALVINFYVALTLFFIAAVLFTHSKNNNDTDTLKSFGLVLWNFLWIVIIGIFLALYALSR